FGERRGHILIIRRAIYGLKSSGKMWWERCSDILRDMGFFLSKAESDIWMRKVDDHYEYIAVYVDDLEMASKNPKALTETFEKKYKLKLKGTGPVTFHLGCDFCREEDGTLCIEPKKYIERMIEGYENMFGSKPAHKYTSPLEKGDHPELDNSPELDMEGVKKYQSMIGALQWAISLGRFDITTAVMTMSSFRVAPRVGHLERVKRIYGYLSKMRHTKIRVVTDMPDWSDVPDNEHDWERTVYGGVTEVIPDDAPEPLGKEVNTSTYVDANLYHNMVTGRAVTGVLHFVNAFPIDWYSKKQGTVETATYGSEFVAAKTATDQIIDLRTTLRYLGVPIKGKAYLFGDNKSVVQSSTVPQSRLNKRHTALAYHRVREAIASGMMVFHHLSGEFNPADILSKHWGYQQIWPQMRPILFKDWNPTDPQGSRKGSEKFPTILGPGTDGAASDPESGELGIAIEGQVAPSSTDGA
ncbi:MAG: hypothetical protein HKN43_15585, partial [Rhodothermales bacterium]|nr:hypothetical protein [Rhodothermales bacterium]